MSDAWDEEFSPAAGTRSFLAWAQRMGASELGEAYDMLEQFEIGNDVPEVLGDDDTVDAVREDLEFGIATVGPGVELTALL
ncbi:hypothetical protein ACTI_52230 [Actinoplanes sp. OR16]|uniref:hypothetical protein n=1 Tax=Actinoplanes sp. OR16 TaxID=946334 RepID=UPI000F7062DB|nr:hypothetical protein [Actinoplanes sp. OR16]BBH68538.1 hypothetical protein ACTI_52230 [Actinoplanes sp. OR16]